MTDIAAIKAELRRLADEAKTLVEPSAEYTEWQRQAAHAFVNFAMPLLLADTPSVEPAGLDALRLLDAAARVHVSLNSQMATSIAAEYDRLLPTQASDSPENQ